MRIRLLVACASLLLAGCTSEHGPEQSDEPWRRSTDPVETQGLSAPYASTTLEVAGP